MFCPFLSKPNQLIECAREWCACWRTIPPNNSENGAQRAFIAENLTATIEKEAGPKPAYCAGWQFHAANKDEPACWVEPLEEARSRIKGYCGLAGKPEM